MTTLTRVQPDTGAVAMESSLVTVNPARRITEADLKDFATGSGLNGPYLAMLLSSSLTHENDGVNLYRALDAMTANPAMKPQLKRMREESEAAVATYATLIEDLGGNPMFASPVARITEAMDAKLLEGLGVGAGSSDAVTLDLKGLEAAMLASFLCVNNCQLLEAAAEAANEGAAKDAMSTAVQQLSPVANSHLEWTRDTVQKLNATQVKSALVEKTLKTAESVTAKVKDKLH